MHIDEATAYTMTQVSSIDGYDTKDEWEFDLEYCQIVCLDNFHPNDKLRDLYITDSKITSIDNFDINKVKELNLSGNKIVSINNFDVKNVKNLSIGCNPIKSVDDFDVKNLDSLDLDSTLIQKIDNFDVKNLKNLLLVESPIEGIYNFNAKNLEYFDLHNTKLEYIYNFYFNPKTIVICALSDDNPIKYVKPSTLLRLRKRFPQYLSHYDFDAEGFKLGLSEKEKQRIREKIKKHGEEYERQKKRKS